MKLWFVLLCSIGFLECGSTEPTIGQTNAVFSHLLLAEEGAANHDSNRDSSQERDQPLSVEESLSAFQVEEGFRVELAACEPQVVDPVAIEFDEQGRLWVVEMGDYPVPMSQADGGGPKLKGRIKVLTDEDSDGFYESSVLFADQLSFPTGLQRFGDGVIVTMAGEIAFLEDQDGDGKCDSKTTWFNGFAAENEQLRSNHPTLTLENQIHVASGLRGGTIRRVNPEWEEEDKSISISQRDFEFDPLTGDWKAVAGNSQFGFYQDQQGRHYVCSNRNPCELLMTNFADVKNPLKPVGEWRVSIMPAAEASQVFPLTEAWTTSNLHAGQFTAACGVFRYESDSLNAQLKDAFFACEPTGSLVQCYRNLKDGLVPDARRSEEGKEFLASRDPWFRPVALTDGPDGSLYVVDMHRAVIEHPDWMPAELKQRADMRWGDQAGRIYRVVSGNREELRRRLSLDLSKLSNPDLLDELEHPNRWRQRTAQRLLLQRSESQKLDPNDAVYIRFLKLITEAQTQEKQTEGQEQAISRLMWLLNSHGKLSLRDVQMASKCKSTSVRLQAIRLMARQQNVWQEELNHWHAQIVGDESEQVRFEWLLQFARQAKENSIPHLISLLSHAGELSPAESRWFAMALSELPTEIASKLCQDYFARSKPNSGAFVELWRRAGWQKNVEVLQATLAANPNESVQHLLWVSFSNGLGSRGACWQDLQSHLKNGQLNWVQSRLAADRRLVEDLTVPNAERTNAFKRIVCDSSDTTEQICHQVIEARDETLWNPALVALSKFGTNQDVSELVLALPELTPQNLVVTRRMLVEKPEWTSVLVDALEANGKLKELIDASTWQRLRRHSDPKIAERAKRLSAFPSDAERLAKQEKYRQQLEVRNPDLASGRNLFATHCANCHRIGGVGRSVGPDISDLRTTTPAQVLEAILEPNRAIDANYFRYVLLTVDGRVLEGLLIDANRETVTLTLEDGTRQTLERGQVESLQATGTSLMPEGLEQKISPEEMVDLIGFVKGWRYPDAQIPQGNGD